MTNQIMMSKKGKVEKVSDDDWRWWWWTI